MATYYKGTLLASPIVRGSSGDTYGTHHSILGVGGYMEVNTLAERNALQPTGSTIGQIGDDLGTSELNFDGISIGQRRLGMLVYVHSENKVYQLYVEPSTWSGYSSTQKVVALANDTNWIEYFSTDKDGVRIKEIYTQTNHNFPEGSVVGYNGSQFIRVYSSGATTAYPAIGMVTSSANTNTFEITYSGLINTTGVTNGRSWEITDYSGGTLTGGTLYFLSDIEDNPSYSNITNLQPTTTGYVSRPVLIKTSGNTAMVLQTRNRVVGEVGVERDTFTGYTATTQLFLDKTVTGATNIGYFSGQTGIQTLTLAGFGTYNGAYNSLYNYYYRDCDGIIRLGSPEFRGDCRRGYVNAAGTYSWIYNQYTGGSNLCGWIVTDGNISNSVGSFLSGFNAYGPPAYQEVTWSGFTTSASTSVDASGSLTTGTTYEVTGPLYRDKYCCELRIRTICSSSPDSISITYDDNFIKVSGVSANQALYCASNGLTKSGLYVTLGGTLTGDTTINADGYVFCLYQGADIIMQGNPVQICSGAAACLNGTTVNLGDAGVTSMTYCPTDRQLTVGCGGTIQSYPGVSGNPNACPFTIKGGTGYVTAGHGGNLYLCGGTGQGAACSGGTVVIQGGTGTAGNGRIKMIGLTGRTTETKLLYIGASGALSCGDVTQQPVTICTAGNYTATNADYFIGTCSGRTVFLPSTPTVGEIKVVADVCGSASSSTGRCIRVDGNSNLILDWSNADIDTCWGSVTFMYNGTDWNVIGFTAAPSYT